MYIIEGIFGVCPVALHVLDREVDVVRDPLLKAVSIREGREGDPVCPPLRLYGRKICSDDYRIRVQICHVNCPNTSAGAEVENLLGFLERRQVQFPTQQRGQEMVL